MGSEMCIRDRCGSLQYAIEDESRNIDLLLGHDFGKPIASRKAGSLAIQDTPEAVVFEATLPEQPITWIVDMERAIDNGLYQGLSPGFRIPPSSAVPNAVELIDEVGNPGVKIRQVNAAVLREMSIVQNPVYEAAEVELRAEDFGEVPVDDEVIRNLKIWL